MNSQPMSARAVFGGGCFWCTEAVFSELRGVLAVEPGYAGGTISDPTYKQVCSGNTGHGEVVRVEFDPLVISFHDLLTVFFGTHDPTTSNKQGGDVGTQYRSMILTTSGEQKTEAKNFIKELNEAHTFPMPIITEIKPLATFYPAEGYHKDYFKQNPDQAYCQAVINPKLAKFRKRYKKLLKKPVNVP